MAKSKAGSQSVNLTPDHEKSGIALIYLCAYDMLHIIGKFLIKATNVLETSS
jgi:hypothetical protein